MHVAGRDITDYIKSRGLKPTDKFLDFGCGALRNGIWLIKYLDAGNYYGIEHDKLMFEAGRDYELPLNGLQVPSFLHVSQTETTAKYFSILQ